MKIPLTTMERKILQGMAIVFSLAAAPLANAVDIAVAGTAAGISIAANSFSEEHAADAYDKIMKFLN